MELIFLTTLVIVSLLLKKKIRNKLIVHQNGLLNRQTWTPRNFSAGSAKRERNEIIISINPLPPSWLKQFRDIKPSRYYRPQR